MRKENFCTSWTVCPLPGKQATPVRLPHDAMIHELRQQQNPSGAGGGYFPGGALCIREILFCAAAGQCPKHGCWR